jgi:hypothetical protein
MPASITLEDKASATLHTVYISFSPVLPYYWLLLLCYGEFLHTFFGYSLLASHGLYRRPCRLLPDHETGLNNPQLGIEQASVSHIGTNWKRNCHLVSSSAPFATRFSFAINGYWLPYEHANLHIWILRTTASLFSAILSPLENSVVRRRLLIRAVVLTSVYKELVVDLHSLIAYLNHLYPSFPSRYQGKELES